SGSSITTILIKSAKTESVTFHEFVQFAELLYVCIQSFKSDFGKNEMNGIAPKHGFAASQNFNLPSLNVQFQKIDALDFFAAAEIIYRLHVINSLCPVRSATEDDLVRMCSVSSRSASA